MNERDLKSGLRQLSHEGWSVADVTDDFLEALLGGPEDPPSDEVKDRCLSKLRARVQDAMKRRAEEPGDLDHSGKKAPQRRRNRKPTPGE